jgi:hypothetical protein
VENSDTGALAVTRDYPRILSADITCYPDSHEISTDTDIPDSGIRGEH